MNRLFFPLGKYHSRYGQYVGWSFLSNIIVSLENAMASHSILSAIDGTSEALRTANYIGKDVLGQMGGLIYLARISQRIDQSPRSFLLYSSIVQQTAFLAIYCTPLIPSSYFLPLAGGANILANVAFAGFGAVNAKCVQRLAIDNNTGEIYAKVSLANTMGSSLGLLGGLGLVILLPDHSSRIALLPALALLRGYTMQRAVENLV